MDPHLLCHIQELLRRVGWLAEHQLRMDGRLQAIEGRLQIMEGQLQAVERSLQALEERLTGMEERPSTRIDKIEYRFEQLKVDTLAGTLQIGLAQGAEGFIEELGAGPHAYQDIQLGQEGNGEPYTRVLEALDAYMETDLNRDIDEVSAHSGADVDPGLRDRIVQDLDKQIRERVLVYMKEIPSKEGPDEAAVKKIMEKVKADVRSGLERYFAGDGKGSSP